MNTATALVLLLSAQAAVGLVKTPNEESPLRMVNKATFDLKEALKEYDTVTEHLVVELKVLQELIQTRLAARSASSDANRDGDEDFQKEKVIKFLLSLLADLEYMDMSALDVAEGKLMECVGMLKGMLDAKGVSQALAPLYWKTETGDAEPALEFLFTNIYKCIGMLKGMLFSKLTATPQAHPSARPVSTEGTFQIEEIFTCHDESKAKILATTIQSIAASKPRDDNYRFTLYSEGSTVYCIRTFTSGARAIQSITGTKGFLESGAFAPVFSMVKDIAFVFVGTEADIADMTQHVTDLEFFTKTVPTYTGNLMGVTYFTRVPGYFNFKPCTAGVSIGGDSTFIATEVFHLTSGAKEFAMYISEFAQQVCGQGGMPIEWDVGYEAGTELVYCRRVFNSTMEYVGATQYEIDNDLTKGFKAGFPAWQQTDYYLFAPVGCNATAVGNWFTTSGLSESYAANSLTMGVNAFYIATETENASGINPLWFWEENAACE
jgi:hypothetical protein